jgi:sec-independent protein translocase protein TatA
VETSGPANAEIVRAEGSAAILAHAFSVAAVAGRGEPRAFHRNILASYPQRRMLAHSMNLLASIMNLGGPDLLIILLLVLVLFGAKKLPELARGMGQAVKEFQKAKDEFSDELHKAGKTEEPTVRPAQANVPRIEPASPGTAATQPDPDQSTTAPGERAEHI